jgi:hypothetical protein
MVEARWPVRTVPDSLRDRYLANGCWSDDTLGPLVDRSPSGAPDVGVHIWSAAAGTVRKVELRARLRAAAKVGA